MKPLKFLFIHCTATPEGSDRTSKQIADYHIKGRGWKRPGYRGIIRLDGTFEEMHDVNANAWVEAGEITNGALGYNSVSHHIAYVGGMDKNMKHPKDTRTKAQRQKLREIVVWYLENVPGIIIKGHNEVAAKACPSFDVQQWLREEGLID